MEPIDPVKYGAMWQKVQDYERRFEVIDKKLDKMEQQLDDLIAMANKGKGGFWVGMTIASMIGAAISWVTSHWK
jgi:response regulator of citrate/malate metabolism